MTDVNALRAKRGEKIDAMAALLANAKCADGGERDLTADEATQYEAFKAEAAALEKQIARAEEVERLKAAMARPVEPVIADPAKPAASVRRPRYAKLRHFKSEEDAYRSGMFLRSILYRDEKAADWCRENGVAVQRAAQVEGTNTLGGYLVPEEFSSAIIDLREQFGVFRQWARVIPMGRDTITVPRRTGGLTARAVGENAEITESNKTWDQVSLTARKWGVLVKYSTELAEDAVISIADDLAGEIAYAFATAEDDAGFNGDGTSTHHGIVGVVKKFEDGTAWKGKITAASTNDTFAEINATDVATVMAALPQYALGGARFYCSQPAFQLVFGRLAQAAGGNTIDTVSGAVRASYLGYPIVISQKMPTSTGDLSGKVMLLFGDMRMAATMGDRRGISIMTSTERYFELDQIGIKGTERFDINVHDIGNTSDAGPLVALFGE